LMGSAVRQLVRLDDMAQQAMLGALTASDWCSRWVIARIYPQPLSQSPMMLMTLFSPPTTSATIAEAEQLA